MSDLKLTKMFRNKKGSLMDIFVWLIIGVIALIFIGMLIYSSNVLSGQFQTLPDSAGGVDISAGKNVTSVVNSAMPLTNYLGLAIIFGMIIYIFISNFLIKAHPVFFIIYLIIAIIAIIFSVPISNSYSTILGDSTIGASLATNKGGAFIMGHLPLWTAIVSIVGAIFLFIGMIRDRELGGGIQ